ncbi:MAG TPA: hypothetical protein VG387_10235 [Rhizomicrobium sp.]|jgi:hypothetical protein|nr:hypothetical protein [Rhizomicrobium sp.]
MTSTTEMPADTKKRVVPTEQARQGETSGHVRYVLHISLALAVIAGVVIWSVYFL